MTPTIIELDVGARQSDVRVQVDPAFSIVGRVVAKDDHARGIGGVGVTSNALQPPATTITTQSDNDGSFELVGMLRGKYVLSADGRGMLFESGIRVDLADKDVTDALIEMHGAVSLSGRIEPPMIAQIGLARPGGDPPCTLSRQGRGEHRESSHGLRFQGKPRVSFALSTYGCSDPNGVSLGMLMCPAQ